MRLSRIASAVAFFTFAALIQVTISALPASAMTTVASIAAGGRTQCAIMTGGAAYCWGDNGYGQLGNGTTTSSANPVLVSGGYTWSSIATADDSQPGDNVATTCGITTGGVAYCWGANTYGNVGDNTTTQRTIPTLVSGGYTWAEISVGDVSVCGVTTANVGYCWGANWQGSLGDGTGTDRYVPTAVSGAHSWASINNDFAGSCGVTTTGAGYCWGYNSNGQIGNGNTSSANTPQAVSGGYTWASLTKGIQVSCGVTTAGVGYCWGRNVEGNIGDGTTNDSHVPSAVAGGYVWSSITTGDFNTCGVTTTGAGYCWGYNARGEVGDGTTTLRSVPTALAGGLTFSTIVVGDDWMTDDTNCGITLGGIEYCWGYNGQSQVGDGTTTDRHSPTEASLVIAVSANTTVSVTVDPSFTFTVANQSSTCNGESNYVSGAGTPTAVALGHLAAGANVSGGQALTVASNAGGGFAVYVAGSQVTQDLRSSSHNWADVSGSYASPAVLGAGERFGYTYKDSTASSSVSNPSAANFIALTNATTNAVMGSVTSNSGSGCVSYDAQTSATTPAASYTATVIYTAVPTF